MAIFETCVTEPPNSIRRKLLVAMPLVLPGLLLPSPPGTSATLPIHMVRFVPIPHFHRPPFLTMRILAVATSSVAVDRRPMLIGPESASKTQLELITTE